MRIRTGYSFKTAIGDINQVAKRMKEIGAHVAPITDRASTFGFNRYAKAAKKEGLRPVFGVELGVVTELGMKKPAIDYWTFLAMDDLRPLHDIIGLATSNPDAEPTLNYDQAMAAKDLIKMTGERVQLHLLNKKAKNLYMGLSPSVPKGLYKAGKAAGFKWVATSDNYFPEAGDMELYRVTLGRRAATQSYPQYILTDAEYMEACELIASKEELAAAIKLRNQLWERSKAELHKATLLIPEHPKSLLELCKDGAKHLGVNLKDAKYSSRLKHELDMIEMKKFSDYFYIIADLIQFAKKRMIVGPARGSSCGSLVCYLLGITTIDPLKFDLLFERFIDISRNDLPDIDIDFSDVNRHLVFEYAEDKYGKDRVARLGTVGLFKPKSALNTAALALQIPKWKMNKVIDSIIERSGGDSRAKQAIEDTLNDTDAGRAILEEYPEIMIASRMDSQPNNASQHAAGIVMTEEPIINYVAIDQRTKSIMCDKKDAEDFNLLKIDALGLTQLSVFERVLELIGETPVSGWLEKLPLDDWKAFEVLNKGHFSGIFQFNGIALQSLTKQVTVESLDDIVSITALARPGPMATGSANQWVRRRMGQEAFSVPHKSFEPYLKPTMGIVIYQETVMQIGKDIGDLSWEDVNVLRRAMAKSLGKEFFDQFGNKWKANAIKRGVAPEIADKVWDDLCSFGSYGFNKSHAVAYGMLSYWACYLKAHYPLEFAAATLDAESEPLRQIMLLRELRSEGIDYVAVDPDHSEDRWVPVTEGKNGRRLVVGPLTQIKGIGPATVKEIMRVRKQGGELRPAIKKRLINARTEIDSLEPIENAIKLQHPDLSKLNIVSKPTPIKEIQPGWQGKVMVFAVAASISPRDENDNANVARRGYEVKGPHWCLNMFVRDDTDEIFVKIDRFKYQQLALPILDRGRAGKAIYAIKGTVPPSFRMISVEQIRYIGDMDAAGPVDREEQKVTATTEVYSVK